MATKRITKKQAAEMARMAETVERLKDIYPDVVCALEWGGQYGGERDFLLRESWKLLVMGRLSAQCTDARVNIVCKDLFERFPTVEAMAEGAIEDIEAIVRPCGLYHTKAQNIKDACRILVEDYGSARGGAQDRQSAVGGHLQEGRGGHRHPLHPHLRAAGLLPRNGQGAAEGGAHPHPADRPRGAERFLPPHRAVRQRYLHGQGAEVRGVPLAGALQARKYPRLTETVAYRPEGGRQPFFVLAVSVSCFSSSSKSISVSNKFRTSSIVLWSKSSRFQLLTSRRAWSNLLYKATLLSRSSFSIVNFSSITTSKRRWL